MQAILGAVSLYFWRRGMRNRSLDLRKWMVAQAQRQSDSGSSSYRHPLNRFSRPLPLATRAVSLLEGADAAGLRLRWDSRRPESTSRLGIWLRPPGATRGPSLRAGNGTEFLACRWHCTSANAKEYSHEGR
jgi:hypothetical protein